MQRIVECVANFSEGRRTEVIREIVASIASTQSVAVLGWESDVDHNRSVVTFAGAPAAVAEAAFAGIHVAAALIDMDTHAGQHPRIGAADVLPFVPLYNVSMDDCVRLARELGARVGAELRIPAFLYGEAALQQRYRRLAYVRRGGYERLRKCIESNDERRPDFGPRSLGGAGACAIGARDILIAFNVYLSTDDVAVARRIARAVRASSGGLPHLMALGLLVKGSAQVSMNLTNYRVTSIQRAVEALRQEAHNLGVAVAGTELIGLAPRAALAATDASYVQIDNFSLDRVLEIRLAQCFGIDAQSSL
ncbi:MAG: glutamate formimidoyltransferase [Chloroflexi bacterium]|nr:glutamate formimidoyltransferase [Chloroflexota bacterium]